MKSPLLSFFLKIAIFCKKSCFLEILSDSKKCIPEFNLQLDLIPVNKFFLVRFFPKGFFFPRNRFHKVTVRIVLLVPFPEHRRAEGLGTMGIGPIREVF